jgi:regulator of sirC expression with transglutaminase-like and TPR domain
VDLQARFEELVCLPDGQIPLDETALLIAAHGHPGLDVAAWLDAIDTLAAGCREPTLDGLRRHLFVDMKFSGVAADRYESPESSFLDVVLGQRRGIPITLSILTMEVGRRVGVPLWGVGMPGHFLVRDKVDATVFLDPFHQGQVLDAAGCRRLFRSLAGPTAPFEAAYLDPTPRLAIVGRVLANLKRVYLSRGDLGALSWVMRLRCALPGMPDTEREEWARLMAPGN